MTDKDFSLPQLCILKDGKEILTVKYVGRAHDYSVKNRESNKKNHFFHDELIYNPSLSPDGKYHSFLTDNGNFRLNFSDCKFNNWKMVRDWKLLIRLYVIKDGKVTVKPRRIPEDLLKIMHNRLKTKIPSIWHKIPHKCWAHNSRLLLFAGRDRIMGFGNIYTANPETNSCRRILTLVDTSHTFNPDLEWSRYGIVITTPGTIYIAGNKYKKSPFRSYLKRRLADNLEIPLLYSTACLSCPILPVKYLEILKNLVYGKQEYDFLELKIPSDIKNMRYGKISPDGKKIMFFGERNKKFHLFVFNFTTGKLISRGLKGNKIDDFYGTWIQKGKISIIKNEMDYFPPRSLFKLDVRNSR